MKTRRKSYSLILAVIMFLSVFLAGCSSKESGNTFVDHRQGVPPDDGLYLAPVRIAFYWGYIDQHGEMVIDHQFTSAQPFSDNLALVTGNGGPRFIDKTGEEAFLLKAQAAMPFTEGLARVKVKGKWGYINTSGVIVIESRFETAGPFSEGYAVVSENGIKSGYIDTNGDYMAEPVYDLALPFSDGLAFVFPYTGGPDPDNKNAYIGYDGEVVLQPELPMYNFDIFSEGLAGIYERDSMRYGFMDKDGNIVIEPTFEKALPFSEGLASVQDNNMCKFVDHEGNVVIADSAISNAGSFSGGMAAILIRDGWGFIDKQGKLIIDCEFQAVGNFSKVD